MDDEGDWAFPKELQPRQEDLRFDLDLALETVVLVRSEIPDDAFTASILGTERAGNGIVIRDDGLVLTIGYLITEARTLWLTTTSGIAIAGYPLAYDQVTGFGLVQPLGKFDVPVLARGSSESCKVGDDVIVIGHGGISHSLKAKIVARHEFAGYWEYVLDAALFTAPAHPQWGGAAVVGMDGRLIGIGSLLVEELSDGKQTQCNMIVPIDLLDPIFDDMTRLGRADRAPRPWLGMYATQAEGHIVVGGLAPGGPAHRAGVRQGDLVLEVAGQRVNSLADLFRKVWALGPAGVEIVLTLAREGAQLTVHLRSIDRNDLLKKPQMH